MGLVELQLILRRVQSDVTKLNWTDIV